jgi:N-methylhydantoinase A
MQLPGDPGARDGAASLRAGNRSEAARNASVFRTRKGVRLAYFPEYGRYAETPVLDRYALGPGEMFAGPAIVEERESTLVIGPACRARVDAHRNVIVEFADRQGVERRTAQ